MQLLDQLVVVVGLLSIYTAPSAARQCRLALPGRLWVRTRYRHIGAVTFPGYLDEPAHQPRKERVSHDGINRAVASGWEPASTQGDPKPAVRVWKLRRPPSRLLGPQQQSTTRSYSSALRVLHGGQYGVEQEASGDRRCWRIGVLSWV